METEPKSAGRPPHVPTDQTRRQVEMMVSFANTQEQIAAILGITEPTLRKHYEAELAIGHVKANNAVAMNLFKQATKDDPKAIRAAEFWLERRAGWSVYIPVTPSAPKDEKLGKKEQALLDAGNPNPESTLGDLMAQRQGLKPN